MSYIIYLIYGQYLLYQHVYLKAALTHYFLYCGLIV